MRGFKHLKSAKRSPSFQLAGCLLLLLALNGCAHTNRADSRPSTSAWIQGVVDYRQHLSAAQQDEIGDILTISVEMREQMVAQFSGMPKHRIAERLARWLLDENGHGMRYDLGANLTPIEAFAQKRGNCLSFTMLMHVLARELGVNIEFNAVDIPDTWNLDEQLGMMFYRHVNGVLTTPTRRQVFDLAMQLYDNGYPQRFISPDQALALLQNNNAVEFLADAQVQQAIHPIKLAISLSPDNPDLWANLGVVMKRHGELDRAILAFKHALKLDKYSIPAASNLERIYRQQGENEQAQALAKQVERARRANPYHHYQLALEEYQLKRYKGALKATNRAIRLHNRDPRFYELKSLIAQQRHNYLSALKSLEKAYALSINAEQRSKYVSKAESVSRQAAENYAERWQGSQNRFLLEQLESRSF
ncbi:MAG: hypothetical protein HKN85_00545 [Gammaproteobacteria bacterium]|nr:hypothetical protein [Gammaproteobacteria bacterium]